MRADTEVGLLAAAEELAGQGWSVVPVHSPRRGSCSCRNASCPAPGKHPRITWEPYTRRVAAGDELCRWWRRWPDANLGVVTGVVSDPGDVGRFGVRLSVGD